MSVYRNGEFIEDEWPLAAPDAALPAAGRVLLPKSFFLEKSGELAGSNLSLGLILQSGETIDGLEKELARFALIVLNIPKFNDGRLYSIARLARERFGYAGEIRAAGEILRDQIPFLYRAGVDSFDVSNPDAIEALRAKSIVAPRQHYQTASREKSEVRQPHSPRARLSEAGELPGVKP